jgi:exodeoxyribonuclease V alpha subunit
MVFSAGDLSPKQFAKSTIYSLAVNKNMSDFLEKCFDVGEFFSTPERAAIAVIRRRTQLATEHVLFAVGLVVWAHRNGDPCVDLRYLQTLPPALAGVELPSLDELSTHLQGASTLVRNLSGESVGDVKSASSDTRPLVLVGSLLFSQRQFTDELAIAYQLSKRAALPVIDSISTDIVEELFPIPGPEDEEARRCGDDGIANRVAKSVLQRKLTVLTGGPGTGKTHTLTRCLAVALMAREQSDVRVALVAPTGKAATRAKELITQFVKEQSDKDQSQISLHPRVLDVLSRIEPKTIQRFLGNKDGQQTRFLHNSDHTVKEEIVIVDEMSMVPAYLMARLLEAVEDDATVLLVGDQAQLESVESGSVLREIVQSSLSDNSILSDCVFELKRVWRQSGETKLGDLARFIRAGDASEALDLALTNPSGVVFLETSGGQHIPDETVSGIVTRLIEARNFASSTSHHDHVRSLEIIGQNKVLCGPREGSSGVNHWNQVIQSSIHGMNDGDLFRPGTPLLVTVNSPRARLVNGDIGVVVNYVSTDDEIDLRVFFPGEEGGRYLSIAELPPVELCYAMTIHKSQGSEYSNLVVFLPGLDSPLLTRELIYTAVTRAKKSVVIVGVKEAFVKAINNVSSRSAGISSLIPLLS